VPGKLNLLMDTVIIIMDVLQLEKTLINKQNQKRKQDWLKQYTAFKAFNNKIIIWRCLLWLITTISFSNSSINKDSGRKIMICLATFEILPNIIRFMKKNHIS
jgi:hypothetical protein